MAKELLIVFVYDCERCQHEEDDPQDAVVYFYPSWVSEQQRLALCGQLIGVTQFFKTSFSPPNILSLQSGKFAIRTVGHFILCVGTDRNIPDLVVETRADTLLRLLKFYHKDFENISSTSSSEFSEKLNQIFETYLPILQYTGNIFGSIPIFRLPKSASNVYLEAIQILQCFQEKPGVLGGVLLCQNKVVCTQLSPTLTKQLVVTDPYRVKMPAENVTTQFHLPVGVQLLSVYMDKGDIQRLLKDKEELREALGSTDHWRCENNNKTFVKATSGKEPPAAPPSVYSGMKRDVSRIFTVMEEEDTESERETEPEKVPDVVCDAVKARCAGRLQSVAPASFVVPDPPQETTLPQTTDSIDNSISKVLPIRYYSLGLPSIKSDWFDNKKLEEKRLSMRPYYNTISDPLYPLFRNDGLPASHALYEARLSRQYHQFDKERQQSKRRRPRSIPIGTETRSEMAVGKKERAKLALTLSLNTSTADINGYMPLREFGSQQANFPIAITPLMAKLSLLALEQQNELPTPSTERTATVSTTRTKSTQKCKAKGKQKVKETEELQNVVLYVCGYQDTTLLLLLESNSSQDPEHIHTLWQTSMNSLNELETHLHHCLDHFPQGTGSIASAAESYSFLCVDHDWGTVQRGGAWAGTRLELLTMLHYHFNKDPHMTDIVVRSEDSMIYGCQCSRNQIFYQQACTGSTMSGLPAPSDLMGVVPLKAKRRLERDHGIVLL